MKTNLARALSFEWRAQMIHWSLANTKSDCTFVSFSEEHLLSGRSVSSHSLLLRLALKICRVWRVASYGLPSADVLALCDTQPVTNLVRSVQRLCQRYWEGMDGADLQDELRRQEAEALRHDDDVRPPLVRRRRGDCEDAQDEALPEASHLEQAPPPPRGRRGRRRVEEFVARADRSRSRDRSASSSQRGRNEPEPEGTRSKTAAAAAAAALSEAAAQRDGPPPREAPPMPPPEVPLVAAVPQPVPVRPAMPKAAMPVPPQRPMPRPVPKPGVPVPKLLMPRPVHLPRAAAVAKAAKPAMPPPDDEDAQWTPELKAMSKLTLLPNVCTYLGLPKSSIVRRPALDVLYKAKAEAITEAKAGNPDHERMYNVIAKAILAEEAKALGFRRRWCCNYLWGPGIRFSHGLLLYAFADQH